MIFHFVLIFREFGGLLKKTPLREKCANAEFILVRSFPAFGVNTEIYKVNIGIESECRKKWIRKNSGFGHFSGSNPERNKND